MLAATGYLPLTVKAQLSPLPRYWWDTEGSSRASQGKQGVCGRAGSVPRGLLEPCPPLFVQEVKPQEAVEGHRCTFSCLFHGRPQPTVTWYNNANERLRFEEGKNGIYQLHIQGVSVTDAGLYSCVAKNVAGTAQTDSELTVQPSEAGLYSLCILGNDEEEKI
uniref:Ig-like domain-containing protein n=1 Tax=Strigops habroptila TaxID=2489341 RepID=A0A672U5X2_STRHB